MADIVWRPLENVPLEILLFIRGSYEDSKRYYDTDKKYWYGTGKAYRINQGPKNGGLDWRDVHGKKIELKVGWWSLLPQD